MLSIFILFFSLPPMVLSYFQQIPLPDGATGPVSLAFDVFGLGPYTGISDGRIIKYTKTAFLGFQEFAFTSPQRSSFCYGSDASKDPVFGKYCGRPLGLGFHFNYLYITDAYFGLLRVGLEGGRATQLAATDAEGIPFGIPLSLDIERSTGVVYFVDFTSNYGLSDIDKAVANQDATGSLLKYDHGTKEVTVLLSGLSGPSGVAVSEDETFLLVTESIASRIQKFWLKGSKANTSEIIITFEGYPANIRMEYDDEFWVAVNMNASSEEIVPTMIKIDATGTILETGPLNAEYNSTDISEVQPRSSVLFIGSMSANFVGVYSGLYGPQEVSTKVQPTVLAAAK